VARGTEENTLGLSPSTPDSSRVNLKYSENLLIRINWDDGPSGIGFSFENRLHWQFAAEEISTNGCFRLHIYLLTHKTLVRICNSLYVFDKRKKCSHKKI